MQNSKILMCLFKTVYCSWQCMLTVCTVQKFRTTIYWPVSAFRNIMKIMCAGIVVYLLHGTILVQSVTTSIISTRGWCRKFIGPYIESDEDTDNVSLPCQFHAPSTYLSPIHDQYSPQPSICNTVTLKPTKFTVISICWS